MRLRRSGRRHDVVFYMPWVSGLLVPGREVSGGAETQIYMLARALVSRGWRVGVAVYPDPDLPREADGIDIIQRPRSRTNWRLVGKLTEIAAIWWTVARIDTAVIVQRVVGYGTGLIAIAARAKRTRFVYSSAADIDFEFDRLEPRRHHVALFELGVRLADEIVVQTGEQERLCLQRFERRPTLVRSIAEPAAQRLETPSTFLWVGRAVGYKRPLAFVELARALPEARFEMVVVPAPDHENPPTSTVEHEAGGLENLTLLSPRPRSEIATLIETAVAVVSTSEFEGMPNVFLEGWARGVPALALSHDPGGVIDREGLGYVADGSFERFADIARRMWQSRTDQSAIAARCRAYVAREHAIEVVVDGWEAVLGLETGESSPRASVPG